MRTLFAQHKILTQYLGLYFLYETCKIIKDITKNRKDFWALLLLVLWGRKPARDAVRLQNILKKSKSLASYRNYGHFEPNFYFCDEQSKTIYLPTPKAASSSIMAYMSREGRKNNQMSYSNLHLLEDPAIMKDYAKRGYFIFAFVRNPYSRLVSFFFNKYTLNSGTKKDGMYHARGFNETYGLEKVRSFADLVERIHYIPTTVIDRHLLPQHMSVYPCPYYRRLINFVGRMENFSEDFVCISEKRYGKAMTIKTNTSSEKYKDWHTYYTPRLQEIVYSKYEEDFKIFDYKADLDSEF